MTSRPLAVLRGWGLAALGAAMLMWSALADGRPPVFTDTALYYSQAEYLFEALGLVSTSDTVSPRNDPTALPAVPGSSNVSASIDGARSPLYGSPIYLLQRAGGLWLAACAQALAVAGMVYLLYRAATPGAARWGYLLLMAGLAALSPLPFFASWIMPDVFAGVAMCGLILLLVYPDRLGAWRLGGVCALTAYGLAVHRSNLLDATAVTLLAAALLWLGGASWASIGRRTGLIVALGAAAIGVGALVYAPIRARAGEPIGTPPFLSARVLADGPGREYLRRVCTDADAPYALCAFRTRPFSTSDQMLWSHGRVTAVFFAASPTERLRMEREDGRFALAATLSYPVAEMRAAGWNALRQFALIYPDGPLGSQHVYVADGYWRRTALPRIIPDAQACHARGSCGPAVSKMGASVLEDVGLVIAALTLAWRLSAPDVLSVLLRPTAADARDDRVRLLVVLGLAMGALAANAIVCGALSGPFPRYQARLVWLAPMAAGLVVASLGLRRRPAHPSLDALEPRL